MKLLGKKILVKEILIPNPLALTDVDRHEVVEVGKDVETIKKGDTVLYEHGRKVNVKGEDYILTDEENVWLIL